jgi:hypothetical protein
MVEEGTESDEYKGGKCNCKLVSYRGTLYLFTVHVNVIKGKGLSTPERDRDEQLCASSSAARVCVGMCESKQEVSLCLCTRVRTQREWDSERHLPSVGTFPP